VAEKFTIEQIKVLGIIDELSPTVSSIKKRTSLDDHTIRKIIEGLEQEGLVKISQQKRFLGISKTVLIITNSGKQEVATYVQYLGNIWKEFIQIASEHGRKGVDEIAQKSPGIVNLMVFFGIVDLATLSRLNLRHLVSANTPCYCCNKELDLKFMQKFTTKEITKCDFKIPEGMTETNHICADCFDKLGK